MTYVALPPRARVEMLLGDQFIAELTATLLPTADQIRAKLREHGLTPTWVSNRAPSWWPVRSGAHAFAIASYDLLAPRTLDLSGYPNLRVWRVTAGDAKSPGQRLAEKGFRPRPRALLNDD